MVGKVRTEPCGRPDALTRLTQAESFLEVASAVVDTEDQEIATAGVAAALAVLAGIAAADAACCARLRERARGQDHKRAVSLVESVHPHGPEMAKDLGRLLARKGDAHYGLHMVGAADANKMVDWAKRLTARAREVIEAG